MREYTKSEIKAIDRKLRAFKNYIMEELDSGRPLSKDVLFISLEDDDWKDIFTKKRTELIRSIASGKDRTVGALARHTNRPRESVSRDLSYLERLRIIRMQRNGKERIPVINKKLIVAAVPTYLS
ncbi:MAG: hypothetical protein NT016_03035 [Candidatus Aenigmarchaeota archaeon]|nr:hypothetical protein [Candidatus Aenigmarchaeota archaeon]